jgi:hypothetical protein
MRHVEARRRRMAHGAAPRRLVTPRLAPVAAARRVRLAPAARGGRGGRGGAPPPTTDRSVDRGHRSRPDTGIHLDDGCHRLLDQVRVAYDIPEGERIVLVTDRRFGAYSPGWKLKSDEMPTDYGFR